MPDEVDVDRVVERQRGDGAIGDEAREEQHEQQHGRNGDRIADRSPQRRLLSRMRSGVGHRLLGGARRAPDGNREHDDDRHEHDGACDEHHGPQVEQRSGLRTRRDADVVDAVHCGRPLPDEGFAVSGFCESMNDSGVRVRKASSRLGAASCGARPAIDRT